jgi:hypothetical protein
MIQTQMKKTERFMIYFLLNHFFFHLLKNKIQFEAR